jgi:hypothetical protein
VATSLTAEQGRATGDLARLRQFTGTPAEFWPPFTEAAARLVGARRAAVLFRATTEPVQWRKIAEAAAPGHADRSVLTFTNALNELAAEAVEQETVLRMLEVAAVPDTRHYAVCLRLQLLRPEDTCVAAFLLLNTTETAAREALLRLRLIADTPSSYQQQHAGQQARADVEKFATTLDLMAGVNEARHFLAASLALCNGVASRHGCDRVSLGWIDHGLVRLTTISRTEKFDRKMDAAQALETVMEEALDQDEELLWPAPEGFGPVTRDHEKFSRERSVSHLCSVPLRLADKPVAALTCERATKPFSELELQQFRLLCDQATPRLNDLKRRDRWWGARAAEAARERLEKLIGPEHTWAKLATLLAIAAFIVACLPIWDYRVEANFILRSEDVTHVTAPFEGFIARSAVRPGDVLKQGGELFALNTVDLELEEVAALADLNRNLREAEKARSAGALADMRIAEALAEQVRARLELVRHRLQLSVSRAPYEGIVVEGDLRQRLGSPVKTGEALFRLARTDALYVEAEVSERDVHEILDKRIGEIAFVSQPKLKFPVTIKRIEPAAVTKPTGNIYLVRLEFTAPPEKWWRPGMSGLAKLEVGKRTPIWVASHRTVDFLRMFFWW